MKSIPAFFLSLIILGFVILGCSSSQRNPMVPTDQKDSPTIPLAEQNIQDSNRTFLGSWEVNFNLDSKTADIQPSRETNAHYNVTSMIPAPSIYVNSYDPINGYVNVDVTVTNPYAITAYDLRLIVYTDSVGHELLYPDDWTALYDIPGGNIINPFRAYGKGNEQRKFVGPSSLTENLVLHLPGMNTNVKIAIDASYPINCEEPYMISNIHLGNLTSQVGATSTLTVDVADWANNTNWVALYLPAITGTTFLPLSKSDGDAWKTTVTNNTGAAPGDYKGVIVAKSSDSGSLVLCDYFTTHVYPPNVPLNPQLAGGVNMLSVCLDIAVQGNYAYVADWDGGMKVISIFDLLNPTVIGSVETDSWALGVAVSGNYAYVADSWDGLYVVDVYDPYDPQIVGTVDTPGSAKAVAIMGNFAYVADGASGLSVINLNNPASPELISTVDTPDEAKDIVVTDSYAYVADRDGGLIVFDISDPHYPEIIGSVDSSLGFAAGVAQSGDYVYLAFSGYGMNVVSVADPANPRIVGNVSISGVCYGVTVMGKYAFVASTFGLAVVDIQNPESPSLLTLSPINGQGQSITGAGNFVYMANYLGGMDLVDVFNPASPVLMGNTPATGFAYAIDITGGYAYLASGMSGLSTVDISSPPNYMINGRLSTTAECRDIQIQSSNAYLANYYMGLMVADVTTPASPLLKGSLDTPGYAYRLDVNTPYVYVADYQGGFDVIDVSDPSIPFMEKTITITDEYPNCTTYSDGRIYVGGYFGGLYIFDAITYEMLGQTNLSGEISDIYLSGNYAYLATGAAFVYVVDVTDPAYPYYVSSLDIPGKSQGICISEDYAYIAAGKAGLVVADVSNPLNPVLFSQLDTNGNTREVEVIDNMAYLADAGGGFKVVKLW